MFGEGGSHSAGAFADRAEPSIDGGSSVDKRRPFRTLRTLRIDDTGSVHTDRLIEKGFFVDSAQSFPVQLVDLVLYYVRKQDEMRLGKKVSAIHQEVFPRLSQPPRASPSVAASW